ncbi:MAG TPA: PLDc N-terminal domain-containing protein [Solirubrobacterales bacterium]|nr:PLDc N-terminal domain-containing protein [Solirubrobacterales bacterium]
MEAFLSTYFAVAALMSAWVAYDVITGQPESIGMMKLAWVLITLYLGPIGLILYLTSCRELAPVHRRADGLLPDRRHPPRLGALPGGARAGDGLEAGPGAALRVPT